MKDFKIETESPISIAEQIEVLELAKEKLLILSDDHYSVGLCVTICKVINDKHPNLYKMAVNVGVHSVIPIFNWDNAVLSGTVDINSHVSYWYWWDTEISKGGIPKRLAFLDWLIERLKDGERENTKRTTTE